MKTKALNTSAYSIELSIGSTVEHLPVIIRKHPKSRHMVIRYQPLEHHVCLTLPRYVTIRQGLHFVQEKRSWLEQQIKEKARHVPFIDGQVIPLLNREYMLCHIGGRGVIKIEDEKILVTGEIEFMERRVRDWLKQQARDEISALAHPKSRHINKTVKKVSVRDTSSRWGSCSHDGNLSFSWRLIFAPRIVLDYVVSHEVAHLKEHNHSPAFWNVVALLCPNHDEARQWLRTHGHTLYGYG